MSSWTSTKLHRVNINRVPSKKTSYISSLNNTSASNIPTHNSTTNTSTINTSTTHTSTTHTSINNSYINLLDSNNTDKNKALIQENINYCLNIYNKTKFSENGKYAAILLESRFDENYSLLLKQISRFLNSDWSVILYVTEQVYDKYLHCIKDINNTIQVKILEYKLNNVKDYNNILLDINFWNRLIDYENVLIFQTDTMIYRYGIEIFLKYDYIGAPWPKELNTITQVGNGGLSLRNVKATIDCLLNLDSIKINKYEQYDINQERLDRQPEDIIFSYGMTQLGYNVANKNIAKFFSIETVEFNELCIGSHRIDIFNKTLGDKLLLNSIIPYNFSKYPNIEGHRFGWNYITNELKNKFINPNGIYLNSWLDCDILFENSINIPKNTNWVGITHLTPVYFKNYYSNCNINNLIKNEEFVNNLNYCKGIFTLSKYMKDYLKNILCILNFPNIPVVNLYHPIKIITPVFNPKSIEKLSMIVSIGSQLRKNTTIFKLKTTYAKIWLPGRNKTQAINLLETECNEFNIELTKQEIESVNILNLSDLEYDNILINSIVVIDLYNASANNALIECISRNIPCFVSNLPAICEYIGKDYPLLFNNLTELEQKLSNIQLIMAGYNYLIERPYLKERLSIDNFISDILNSEITKNILQ